MSFDVPSNCQDMSEGTAAKQKHQSANFDLYFLPAQFPEQGHMLNLSIRRFKMIFNLREIMTKREQLLISM